MERPLSFMNVWGISSRSRVAAWPTSASSPWSLGCWRKEPPSSAASRSTAMKPTLWRVSKYFGPGLPRPTTS